MRAIVQRVARAEVTIEGRVVGRITKGLLVYAGVAAGDDQTDVDFVADKIRHLRIFTDEQGKLNLDVQQAGGAVLLISNFTLMADARKGRRPEFTKAAKPHEADALYQALRDRLVQLGLEVPTGRFREMMAVAATNDGPINILLDSKKLF